MHAIALTEAATSMVELDGEHAELVAAVHAEGEHVPPSPLHWADDNRVAAEARPAPVTKRDTTHFLI